MHKAKEKNNKTGTHSKAPRFVKLNKLELLRKRTQKKLKYPTVERKVPAHTIPRYTLEKIEDKMFIEKNLKKNKPKGGSPIMNNIEKTSKIKLNLETPPEKAKVSNLTSFQIKIE